MMSKKIIVASFFSLFIYQNTYGQIDTLINYNTQTRQMYSYPPVKIDSLKLFDNTNWNFGNEGGVDILDLNPPLETYNNSGFTDFTPLQNLYSVSNFPSRTAVILFLNKKDTLKQKCSGILVASNYVLTDCHCIGDYDSLKTLKFYDSLWVYPAYDNGIENPQFGKSIGVEYITFKSNLHAWFEQDIALIKLKDEIGIKTGWVGIAFSNDDEFYQENVFHKFSYPGSRDQLDSTRFNSGDTLYYNYGTLDLIDDTWIGYGISGIPGQSGSSLFYTNNEEYYSVGTQVWSRNSRHLRITPEIFYSFQYVLNNNTLNLETKKILLGDYYLSDAYPNPFNPRTTLEYTLPRSVHVSISVYNLLGQQVESLIDKRQTGGKYKVHFDCANLSSGLYFVVMEAEELRLQRKIVLIK